jgi:hypothetical protein
MSAIEESNSTTPGPSLLRDRGASLVRAPGGLALHPTTLLALALLVVNDHWAKEHFANALTGKLSDLAGLALVPAVLVATIELASGRAARDRPRWVLAAALVTGAIFAACKLSLTGAELYRSHWGWLRAPWDHLNSWAHGLPAPPGPRRVAFARDPSDLVALLALLVPWWAAREPQRPKRGRSSITQVFASGTDGDRSGDGPQ